MADSSGLATPPAKEDMDLQTAQGEEAPGKILQEKDLEKNGSETQENSHAPDENDQRESNGHEKLQSSTSANGDESEAMDTCNPSPETGMDDIAGKSSPIDKPSPGSTSNSPVPMEMDQSSESGQGTSSLKDSDAGKSPEPDSTDAVDKVTGVANGQAGDSQEPEQAADSVKEVQSSNVDDSAGAKEDASPIENDDTKEAKDDTDGTSSSNVGEDGTKVDTSSEGKKEDATTPIEGTSGDAGSSVNAGTSSSNVDEDAAKVDKSSEAKVEDATSSIEGTSDEASSSVKEDTPSSTKDESTVEDSSKAAEEEKDRSADVGVSEKEASRGSGESSSTSPVVVAKVDSLAGGDNASNDVSAHSIETSVSEPASKSGSESGSTSGSPRSKSTSEVKSEEQAAKDDKDDKDADVVILDDKKEGKKPAPVKQEPSDGDAKEGQSKKSPRQCIVCCQVGKCKYNIVRNGCTKHLCDDLCYRTFKQQPAKYLRNDKSKPAKSPVAKGKFCAACNVLIADHSSIAVSVINGETKEFCGAVCKDRFANGDVDDEVEIVGTSNVSNVGSSKGKHGVCCVCMKQAVIKHEMHVKNQMFKLCSNACFTKFSKDRNLSCELCEQCFKPCQKASSKTQCIQFEGKLVHFCSTICLNVFKTTKQKIVSCSWCHAKKSNFDMVERIDGNSKCQVFCSLNCLSLYRVQLQATSQTNVCCDQCKKPSPAQYHLTMSDASVRNFCSYDCVVQFQKQFMPPSNNINLSTNEIHQNVAAQAKPPPIPPSQAKQPQVPLTRQSSRQAAKATQSRATSIADIPVISNVVSLAPNTGGRSRSTGSQGAKATAGQSIIPQTIPMNSFSSPYQVVIEQPPPVSMKNKGLLTRPNYLTKATSCRPHTVKVGTQTDEELSKPQGLLPVPIPIYVPVPMKMYHHPVPYPIPIPVPIPVPVFIPTTKKSANSILKHIKELQHKIPEDPFEAELLQMAEAVANAAKPQDSSDSEDDAGTEPASPPKEDSFDVPDQGDLSNSLGEDIVQAALRLSQGFDQPVLDLEDSLAPSCIDPDAPGTRVEFNNTENEEPVKSTRGRKRGRGRGRGRPATKRRKVVEEEEPPPDSPIEPPPPLPSDADFALKFTYGVNAWTHWVIQKNGQIEGSDLRSGPKKRFKTSLLACSAEELNKSLCLFVKEVRKPNGEEYAADSIFYLCLGIQQYLYENGRIDNIFTDWYFEKFTECLDEVLATYEPKLNSYGLIVCRLEEEHLWECKQLGAHSPHVLLLTLIYFNTKFFMLRTAEDHLRLSFSHVVKHWKKSPIGAQGSGRSVYLKYYAPNATASTDNRRKKDDPISYEQMENADNPLRCPVKLYEFYLSKCPESIRNRSDVFYLVPERSCVPDSPVWYSTQNLSQESMTHLLNRVRCIREIQESFLLHPSPS